MLNMIISAGPSLWLWDLRLTFVSSSSLRPSPPWRISCPTLAWTPDYQHTCNRTSGVNKNSFRLSLCCLKSLCSHVHFKVIISAVVRVEFSDEDESRCDAVPCGSWMLPGTTRRLYADCDTFMAPAVHNVYNVYNVYITPPNIHISRNFYLSPTRLEFLIAAATNGPLGVLLIDA